MKQIVLTKGKFAIVDDEDFEYLSQFKWSCLQSGYAMRGEGGRKNRKYFFMHKEIMGQQSSHPDNLKVDHINRNKLDNRRCNLRECTHKQNAINTGLKRSNKTGYKGVYFDKGKWTARIRGQNSKQIVIGRFKDIRDAATAYNFVAYGLYGEFAYMNKAA